MRSRHVSLRAVQLALLLALGFVLVDRTAEAKTTATVGLVSSGTVSADGLLPVTLRCRRSLPCSTSLRLLGRVRVYEEDTVYARRSIKLPGRSTMRVMLALNRRGRQALSIVGKFDADIDVQAAPDKHSTEYFRVISGPTNLDGPATRCRPDRTEVIAKVGKARVLEGVKGLGGRSVGFCHVDIGRVVPVKDQGFLEDLRLNGFRFSYDDVVEEGLCEYRTPMEVDLRTGNVREFDSGVGCG